MLNRVRRNRRALMGSGFTGFIPNLAVSIEEPGDALPYDYLITNDTEFSDFLAFARANEETVAGKIVGIQPGPIYQTPMIGGTPANEIRPSTWLTFRSTSASVKPKIHKLVLGNCSNIRLQNLELINQTWTSSPGPCVQLSGNIGNYDVQDCYVHGLFRGTVAPEDFDPTDLSINENDNRYPEYAAIEPTVSGGVITNLTIQRKNIGNYTPDGLTSGTYNLIFTDPGAPGSVATGTMTVVDGVIVSTNLTYGGTEYPSSGLSNIVSWVGQKRMTDYLPYGFQLSSASGHGTAVITGSARYENNRFVFLQSAIKHEASQISTDIIGNFIDLFYTDAISIPAGLNTGPITIAFNEEWRGFSNGGDPGDPHSDSYQQWRVEGAGDTQDIDIYGNIFARGNSRGGFQLLLIQGSYGKPYRAHTIGIVGNYFLNQSASQGIWLSRTSGLPIFANVVARFDKSHPQNGPTLINQIGYDGAGAVENTWWGRNISEALPSGSGGTVNSSTFPNTVLANQAAYEASLAAPLSQPSTLAGVISAFTGIGGASGNGPVGVAGLIDIPNRTIDLTRMPVMAEIPAKTNQVVGGTNIESDWVRMVGGPASGIVITPTNLGYRTADDVNGAPDTGNATAWSTSPATGAFRGKWVQVRRNASGSGSTTVTGTLNIDSGNVNQSYTYNVTTTSTAYTAIDNQATAWSAMATPRSSPAMTGLKKFIIAARFKPDSLVVGNYLFGAVTTFHMMLSTGPVWRFQMVGSGQCRVSASTTAPVIGQTHTQLWTIDFDQPVMADGVKSYVNDVAQTITGTWAPPASTSEAALFGSSLGVFSREGGALPVNGDLEFLWMHWGDASLVLPDLSDANVRNRWTRDNINVTDGSGPLLGIQPKIFIPGAENVADWNSVPGLTNRGSIAIPFIKGGGTYA